MKIFIATPCYTGKTSIEFTIALANTMRMARDHNVNIEFIYTKYDALVQKSRNYFVAYALQNGADQLLMIDDDIGWRPEWIFRLINFPQDVVSGIYRKKQDVEEYPFKPFIREDGEWYPPDVDTQTGLIRVAGVPTGFLKLSRKAMQALWDTSRPYKNGILPEERAIFDMTFIGNEMFSEDYVMCQRLAEARIPVWLDPRMTCLHDGYKVYEGRFDLWLTIKAKNDNFFPYLWSCTENLHKSIDYKNWRVHWTPVYEFLVQSKNNGYSPRVVYDIGACYGEFAAIIKHIWPGVEVYAFEAMQDKVQYLVSRCKAYNIDVLSDEDGRLVKFYTNKELPGGNSYYLENTVHFSEDRYEERETRSLDSIVKERGFPPPDFIKIDVQGAELDILRGATKTLQSVTHMIVELQHVQYNQGATLSSESLPIIESMGFTCVKPRITRRLGPDDDYAFVRKINSEK